jgi:hypothetical protein
MTGGVMSANAATERTVAMPNDTNVFFMFFV